MWECDLFDGGCVNRFLRRWSEGVFFWQGQIPSTALQRMETSFCDTITFTLLKSDTKYRVIADGNPSGPGLPVKTVIGVRYQVPRYSGWKRLQHYRPQADSICWKPSTAIQRIETRIHELCPHNTSSVGNQVPRYSGLKLFGRGLGCSWCGGVGNQVPRYSGFKIDLLMESDRFIELSSSVVSITNAWCYTLCTPQQIQTRT